jgi:hypothetical protein
MKAYIRKAVSAGIVSLWLSVSAHASHENLQTSQPTSVIKGQSIELSADPGNKNPYADELWLIGSFLVSLTGLILFVRLMHR